MSQLLKIFDEKIEPLVNDIDSYIKKLNVHSLASFYDPDWCGIPSQILLDAICEKVHGERPSYTHWLSYEHAIDVSKSLNRPFTDVCFLDYEPHEEVTYLCKNAKNVGIFGHHIGRDDVVKLCKDDSRFTYFNPRSCISDIKEQYERGMPILYPIWKVAERYGLDHLLFLTQLGVLGYGYVKLYKEMKKSYKTPNIDKKMSKIIESVVLLVSYRLSNCSNVIEVLHQATSPDDEKIKGVITLARGPLLNKKSRVVVDSISKSRIIGDVELFPVESDFDQLKPIIVELDRTREGYGGLRTTVCIKIPSDRRNKLRKISIRTSRNDVEIPDLLKEAHKDQSYKNYGAHEKSGGFISYEETPAILASFLNIYFQKTGQRIETSPTDLFFLCNSQDLYQI
jgi:hypothetical protein